MSEVEQEQAQDRLASRWHGLQSVHAAVWGALERELQRHHDMGVSEFEALELLATCEHDKCRAAELADAVPLSQSAASRLTARLERAGFVQRAMCDLDRRGVFVLLTDEGRRRYLEAKPTHRAVLVEMMTGLGALGADQPASASAPGAGVISPVS